jgi:uncharacterized protein
MSNRKNRYQKPNSSKIVSTQKPITKDLEFSKKRLEKGKIEFIAYGGVQEVGRSAFILQNKETSILLEGGVKLKPFEPTIPPYGLENHASELDAIVLSHAHVDHSAYIPTLYENGFEGPSHMTHPTLEIAYLLWKDHLKIEGERFWSEDALEITYDNVIKTKYNNKIKLIDDIELEFIRAGHILGSAMAIIHWDGYKILYTGDINDNYTPFFEGFDLPEHEEPFDLVISEGTNGCGSVPNRADVGKNLVHETLDTLNRGHKVLIPVFAVGRSQEMICLLTDYIKDFPIYVDGMINKMNQITERYLTPDWVDPPILDRLKREKMKSPFDYQNIYPITRDFYDRPFEFRKHMGEMKDPFILLSTSGMLQPSPMHTHLRYHVNNPNNLLAFVGYQAEGTIGRDIIDGKKDITIQGERNNNIKLNIKSRIMQFRFSGHASQEGIQLLLNDTNPKNTVFVHGDATNINELQNELKTNGNKYSPAIKQSILFDV